MLTKAQGRQLVKLARAAIKAKLEGRQLKFEKFKKLFSKPCGVFVSLHKDHQLRGCIGFPRAIKPLAEAVVEAAQLAAFSDVRFEPLKKEELKQITIEVSVLTEPKLIIASPQEIPNSIEPGKDGLIVEFLGFSGLLLPQVAIEQHWNSLELLRGTCIKAGLPPDCWLNPKCKVYKFQAQIFSEEKRKRK